MADEKLDWVGSAPLDPALMNVLRRDLIIRRIMIWVPAGLIVASVLMYSLGISLKSNESIGTMLVATVLGVTLGRMSGRVRYNHIRSALVKGMDIAPLLAEEEKHIGSRLLGMPGGSDILDVIMRPEGGGKLAKDKDKWGRVIYRTRGTDPKGPAEGGGADTIEARMPRIDAMTPRPEFDGLEDKLTDGEKLVEEANVQKNEAAQAAWDAAEASDPDLIESGVENLGDLVATGQLRPSEGGFPQAPKREEPDGSS